MREKEQAQALKLLAEWLAAARLGAMETIQGSLGVPGDLVDRTEKFLSLPPESHGQRRG